MLSSAKLIHDLPIQSSLCVHSATKPRLLAGPVPWPVSAGLQTYLEDSESYISELAIGIDYTAKDVLAASRENKGPWALAKGLDGASPISGFKSISNYQDLSTINFDLIMNGEQKQIGNTSLMIYSFAEIIAYVSSFMTLEIGDLIFTGTPASGAGLVVKGDHLQASIESELLLDFKMI